MRLPQENWRREGGAAGGALARALRRKRQRRGAVIWEGSDFEPQTMSSASPKRPPRMSLPVCAQRTRLRRKSAVELRRMADNGPEDRLYPPRPILAVSVAVFRQGRVLVGRRARPPMAGRFSLPGGVVEIGETLIEAALRELYEEVGVEAEIVGFNRHIEPIVREGGRVRAHFVIASFVGRWTRGEARVSPEIDAVAWIEPVRLGLAARRRPNWPT